MRRATASAELSAVRIDPARGEKSPTDVLKGEQIDLARLSSLQLASQNALVSSQPARAKRLSEALGSKPSLAPFALGLKGDVALAENSPQRALEAYDACAEVNAAPSCTLRKAEAQVMLQDVPAAQTTLSQVAAQTPVAARSVTKTIAVDAAKVATAQQGR